MTKRYNLISIEHQYNGNTRSTWYDTGHKRQVYVFVNATECCITSLATAGIDSKLKDNKFNSNFKYFKFPDNDVYYEISSAYRAMILATLDALVNYQYHEYNEEGLVNIFGSWTKGIVVNKPITDDQLLEAVKKFVDAHNEMVEVLESTVMNDRHAAAISNEEYPLTIDIADLDFFEWYDAISMYLQTN